MSEFVKFVFDFKYRFFPIIKYSTQVNKGKPSDHPPACESIFLSRVEGNSFFSIFLIKNNNDLFLLLFLIKMTCKHCTCISCGEYTGESCARHKQRTDEIKANSHPSRAVWHKKPDLTSSVLHPVKKYYLAARNVKP